MNQESKKGLRESWLADEKVKEETALRAYFIFERRGYIHGHDEEDWRQAESEVIAELVAQYETQRKKQLRTAATGTKKVTLAEKKKADKTATQLSKSTVAPKTKQSATRKAKAAAASGVSHSPLDQTALPKPGRSRSKQSGSKEQE